MWIWGSLLGVAPSERLGLKVCHRSEGVHVFQRIEELILHSKLYPVRYQRDMCVGRLRLSMSKMLSVSAFNV